VASDLELALSLADAADALTLARFRAPDLRVETKPDLTPVSEADHAVEEAIRAVLARERPDDIVVGEEFGDGSPASAGSILLGSWGAAGGAGPEGTGRPSAGPESTVPQAASGGGEAGLRPAGADAGQGRRRWIVDPIDATKNYVRGIPLFATLIALEDSVAVVSAPALPRRWWATRGGGAFADGEPLSVSRIERLEDAVLTYTSVRDFGEPFLALARRVWAPRGFGDFWQYMLLAEGCVDVSVEASANLWDLAAPKLIVEEAGGRLTDLDGNDTAGGGNALASNGLLHAAALAALRAE